MRYIPFIVCATVLSIMFIDGWIIQKWREKKKLAFAKLAAQRDKEKTDLLLAVFPFQRELSLERALPKPNLKMLLLKHQQELIDLDYDPVYEKVKREIKNPNGDVIETCEVDTLTIDLGHTMQRLYYA